MKKLQIIQGTPEWHQFRSQGIGASEIAELLGHGTKTWRQLWKEKKGITSIFETEAMKNGKLQEPLALEHIKIQTGIDLSPVCGIHDTYDWIRCSFDGYSEEAIFEIKTPFSEKTLSQYARGDIPEKWIDQVKWQSLVAGKNKGTLAIWGGRDCFFYEYTRDEKWTDNAMKLAAEFWDLYISDIVPLASAKDYVDEYASQSQQLLVEKLKWTREEKRRLEEIEKEIIKNLTEGKEGNFILGNISFCQTKTTSYDYKKMIEDFSICKENYRKESQSFWKWR